MTFLSHGLKFEDDGSLDVTVAAGTVVSTPPANASTNITQFGGNAVATGAGAGGNGVPRVTISSDSTQKATTSTLTNVSASASNVQLLASTAGRRGAMFVNDSTASLYMKFGTTATTSSFTVKVGPGGYYEMPLPIYTGQIDGIWSAANGAVRITELT